MSKTIQCEGCRVAVPAPQIQLDDQGRQLCRRCTALEVIADADEAQRAAGARRKCRRCNAFTLIQRAPWEPVMMSGYGPAGSHSTPWAVGHGFRCVHCKTRFFLLSPGGFIVLAHLLLIAAGAYHAKTDGSPVGIYGAVAIFGLAVTREVFLRRRYPTS